MAGFIIWLVIIFVVVAINKRNVSPRGASRSGSRNPTFDTVRGASGGQQGYPSQGQSASAPAGRATGPVKQEDPWSSYQYSDEKGKQQALKERLAKKYNRTSSGGSDILSRAKASVEEDFGQTWEQEEAQKRQQREQKERQRQAKEQKERQTAKAQNDVMRARELERRTQEMLQQTESLPDTGGCLDSGIFLDAKIPLGQEQFDLDAVWDLMVKGPNMELTFERDFIAEGVEMLNRIQA